MKVKARVVGDLRRERRREARTRQLGAAPTDDLVHGGIGRRFRLHICLVPRNSWFLRAPAPKGARGGRRSLGALAEAGWELLDDAVRERVGHVQDVIDD